MPDRREQFRGIAVVTPYIQSNGVLVLDRRESAGGTVAQWCPVSQPSWDGYVAWPKNLPRWECYA